MLLPRLFGFGALFTLCAPIVANHLGALETRNADSSCTPGDQRCANLNMNVVCRILAYVILETLYLTTCSKSVSYSTAASRM